MHELAVTSVDLARLQFATTSLYHFLFVPLTLGLAPLVAVMQTLWYRGGDEAWLRLARFFGTLMLINFAIGVATGLVQEFQFGMNWSIYSEFVGDVFGAPLAIEGLAAFMLESTFLGLWIFGWDRLSRRVHLATIWLFALGSWASAFFIIAANSWMQRPVGSTVRDGRAELTDVWELFSNRFGIWAYIHVLLVGLTRMWLGVHFLSDVIGGWSLGVAWSLLTALVFGAFAEGHRDDDGCHSDQDAKSGQRGAHRPLQNGPER